RLDGRRIVSAPPKVIEPSRCPTIPMIDLSVVVLPAPLRPKSVTTSPLATLNAAPWRICDSPYHALRSRTDSSEAPGAPSGMAGISPVKVAKRLSYLPSPSGRGVGGEGTSITHARPAHGVPMYAWTTSGFF